MRNLYITCGEQYPSYGVEHDEKYGKQFETKAIVSDDEYNEIMKLEKQADKLYKILEKLHEKAEKESE